jgi:vancomycin resistance protein YoaR
MKSYTFPQNPPSHSSLILGQLLATLMLGLGLFLGLLALAPFGYAMTYDERIYPGVSVGGVDLSGLTQQEAAVLLVQQLQYSERGRIAFQDGTQVWQATPRELGLYVDVQSSLQAAYTVGRSGGFFTRFEDMFRSGFSGVHLSPIVLYDERQADAYLHTIAQQIDKPIVEASLSVNGVEVIVSPGQVGRQLDVPAGLAALRAPLQGMTDALIALSVRETAPVILDASEQAEIARRILSAALTIDMPERAEGDPGPWTFEPQALAGMLSIERVQNPEGERYQVGLNSQTLREFLQGLAPSFARSPENARFIFDDETHQLELIQEAVIGRSLNIEASLSLINEKLFAGEHNANLVLDTASPDVRSEATAEQLGITGLVSEHTSYFYGSGSSRMQNIQAAASRFHGLLVPPGATFSMSDALGDISLDNGYAEALIILGDRTIKGVGGGVCQVSTTLFRTVFLGGFPIVERHPHAYRVGYYEQTASGGYNANLAGLDATVFVPVVDFKFTNDTPYWLLMETYFNQAGRRLTWKFYSTSDGRSVDWETTGVQNVVEPPKPLYEENPELAQGEIKQVDWEAEGADITVYRTVTRGGETLFKDTITTHYLPWRAVYQYGPGTEIPAEEEQNN